MGWGRMLLLGDFGQQMDLQDQRREIDAAREQLAQQGARDRSQDRQIRSLQRENEELRLYVFALVRLLERKGTVTPDEVAELVKAIEKE